MDLEAYFRRIGYSGDRAPTLEALRTLHQAHVLAIPFENLSPLLGEPVSLDIGALEDKLVRRGRGGYCYEHNVLFRHVLERLGFSVAGLAARVLWNAPAGVVRPRTHMLLRVDFDRRHFIADVGFGNFTLTAPLDFDSIVAQPTPHEAFRLVPAGGEFRLEIELAGGWAPLYAFDLQEQGLADYELGNWYVSTHPQSQFVTDLIVSRTVPGKRVTLRNNSLAVHPVGGTTARRTLGTAGALREVLQTEFGITLPALGGLDAKLAQIAGRPAMTA